MRIEQTRWCVTRKTRRTRYDGHRLEFLAPLMSEGYLKATYLLLQGELWICRLLICPNGVFETAGLQSAWLKPVSVTHLQNASWRRTWADDVC